MKIPENWRPWLAIVCAAIAAATGIVVTIDDGGNNTISITVQTPSGPTQITAPAETVENLQTHTNLNADPTSLTGSLILAEGKGQRDAFAQKDNFPTVAPNSSPTVPGCRSRFINTNYGSRNGIKPRLIVLHLTVSPDNGWTGVNNITSFFGRPQTLASSNYVVSGSGHCNYIVRETDKAYTQAGLNPVSISFEVTATQTQGYYVRTAGREKLANIIAGISKRWGIPLRVGKTSGCSVVRSGVLDHDSLGVCGGNHNDINPYRYEINRIINLAKTKNATRTVSYPRVSNFGPKKRAWCERLAIIRKNAKASGWTESRVTVATTYKRLIGKGSESKCKFV